jgi:hypothetical protein
MEAKQEDSGGDYHQREDEHGGAPFDWASGSVVTRLIVPNSRKDQQYLDQ